MRKLRERFLNLTRAAFAQVRERAVAECRARRFPTGREAAYNLQAGKVMKEQIWPFWAQITHGPHVPLKMYGSATDPLGPMTS